MMCDTSISRTDLARWSAALDAYAKILTAAWIPEQSQNKIGDALWDIAGEIEEKIPAEPEAAEPERIEPMTLFEKTAKEAKERHDKAIAEHEPISDPFDRELKSFEPVEIDESKQPSPKSDVPTAVGIVETPVVNSKNSNAWKPEELAIIRTAAKIEDAVKFYRQQYGEARNQNGIEQKWQKLRREKKLILKGMKCRLNNPGSIYHMVAGIVTSIADNHLTATVEYEGNTKIQIPIERLEAVV